MFLVILSCLFENCATLAIELCPILSLQVYVVWVLAYQGLAVGHCFFRFIAAAADQSCALLSSS
jgi:hypothetical protein